MVKTLSELSRGWYDPIPPDKIILHVMWNAHQESLEKPTRAEEISCPRCGKKEGFYIPHLATWSCAQVSCIHHNAGKIFQRTQEKIVKSLVSCGVSEQYEEANLSDCKQKIEIIKALSEFSKKPKGFLLLAGNNGTGKTYAACACLREYLDQGNTSARFFSISDINFLWLDNKKVGTEGDFATRFISSDFLILDDMGIRSPSNGFLDFLYFILDKRQRSSQGTIITTSKKSHEIKEFYGEDIFSRICSAKILIFEGEDRRRIEF